MFLKKNMVLTGKYYSKQEYNLNDFTVENNSAENDF
jgi:hypothetical protein